MTAADLRPQPKDPRDILVRADRQAGAQVRTAPLPGREGRALQLKGETRRAPRPSLRFIYQPRHPFAPNPREVGRLDDGEVGLVLLKDVQGGKTPKVLVLRLDVGPVEKTDDLPTLHPKLTHRNRNVKRATTL